MIIHKFVYHLIKLHLGKVLIQNNCKFESLKRCLYSILIIFIEFMIYIFKVFHYCLSILTKGGNSMKNSTCKRKKKTHRIQSKISILDFVSDSLAHFQTFVYPKSIHSLKLRTIFHLLLQKLMSDNQEWSTQSRADENDKPGSQSVLVLDLEGQVLE